jgi:hypothetical protein
MIFHIHKKNINAQMDLLKSVAIITMIVRHVLKTQEALINKYVIGVKYQKMKVNV